MQTHLKDPLVLTHTEVSGSHWLFPVSHSFMSANQELMLNYQSGSIFVSILSNEDRYISHFYRMINFCSGQNKKGS